MTGPATAVVPVEAYRQALVDVGERAPALSVVEANLPPTVASSRFAERFPPRYALVPSSDLVAAVAERARDGAPVFAGTSVAQLVDEAFPELVRSLIAPGLNVKLVGFPAVTFPPVGRPLRAVRDDLAAMRALPKMTVVAPADAPTLRAATVALGEREGPAYLRLPPPDADAVGDTGFAIGRARELRAGSDLAIVAVGPMLSRALAVADELSRVGISVRVLDVASIRPFDAAAVLRAARDTGGILVVEAGPLATGIGTLVAAMTAENYPVPVRRLGLPDVWPERGAELPIDDYGLSLDRVRDEAWELLRLKGKIT
jgi:transketolase